MGKPNLILLYCFGLVLINNVVDCLNFNNKTIPENLIDYSMKEK